jgi:hypothetical protein
MLKKKNVKKASKRSSTPTQTAPFNFTDEHVRMAREGRSKEVFELVDAQRRLEQEYKKKPRR